MPVALEKASIPQRSNSAFLNARCSQPLTDTGSGIKVYGLSPAAETVSGSSLSSSVSSSSFRKQLAQKRRRSHSDLQGILVKTNMTVD